MSKKGKKINQQNRQQQKIKLRTSMDVYHRLIHDSTLPINRSKVMIGYTDGKYEDIQHLPLYEWVLIDRGGDIPMHHIVYFKYKDIILWDKRIRLDRLYGSGNTKPSQLLKNILKEENNDNKDNDDNNTDNNDNNKSFKDQNPIRSNKVIQYPSNGKIIANPRKVKATDSKLTKKGIKMVSYIYSFGIIGYKFKMIQNKLSPIFLVIQHQKNKQWGFPKGRYEAGENKFGFDTARREFEEESGISFIMTDKNGNNGNITSVDWRNPFISNYEYKWKDIWIKKWTVLFAAELSKTATPKIIRPKEIGNIKWMILQQFNEKNKHKEYKDIMQKLNNKLMKQIKKDNDNIDDVKSSQNDEEQKYEDISTIKHEKTEKEVNKSPIKQRKIVSELVKEVDDVIHFLTLKLKLYDNQQNESNEIEVKEEKKSYEESEKQRRKKRISYLMKKQQNHLWNIFKTKYKYKIPTINELKQTFKNELNELNNLCSNALKDTKIKYEDIFFIFNTIFSKRKRDINENSIIRTKQEWNKIFERYPMDKENYAMSFEYNDEKTWLPLLNKYGFVVISNVLSSNECDKTVQAFFQDVNKRNAKDLHIDINNYKTWDNKYWPSPKRKFLTDCPAFHAQAFKNRFNKKIEYVFSKIFNTNKLNVSIDNWGFQRPYKIYTENGDCIINKKWQYSLQPHWDYSPWLFVQETQKLNFQVGYQGIVALNDHNITTGCHRNLPCSVNHLVSWTKEHQYPYSDKIKYNMYNDDNMVYLRKSERPKKDDEIVKYMQDIPMKKGDFIIWSWGSLHGNTPNIGDKWRFVQYIRMFPASSVHENYSKHDRYSAQKILNNKGFREILFSDQFYKNMKSFCRTLNLSKREKCLLGIENW